jgi:hypothetical protein
MLQNMTKDLAAKPHQHSETVKGRAGQSYQPSASKQRWCTFLESRYELSVPNLFEGAKEVPLPLLRDLQVDIN